MKIWIGPSDNFRLNRLVDYYDPTPPEDMAWIRVEEASYGSYLCLNANRFYWADLEKKWKKLITEMEKRGWEINSKPNSTYLLKLKEKEIDRRKQQGIKPKPIQEGVAERIAWALYLMQDRGYKKQRDAVRAAKTSVESYRSYRDSEDVISILERIKEDPEFRKK